MDYKGGYNHNMKRFTFSRIRFNKLKLVLYKIFKHLDILDIACIIKDCLSEKELFANLCLQSLYTDSIRIISDEGTFKLFFKSKKLQLTIRIKEDRYFISMQSKNLIIYFTEKEIASLKGV